ncbi:MAG TPA: 7-carboxy-7-deazaguanine synthase QueE [Candidatus Eremiobacteraceae bacterium]|nr:7-carboxy-7-deazaguanine synthase QueE [Candidatus Eremiobacteraceae bacterium]
MRESATLRVNETFFSVQGEGTLSGAATFFIRLDGCPLRCAWCDTPYALDGTKGTVTDVDALATQAHGVPRVVITGGEPLAQDIGPLVDALDAETHVTVETSGTIFADIPRVALFSVSPKVGSSGYKPKPIILQKFFAAAKGRLQLKFVISDARDLEETLDCLLGLESVLPAGTPIVLQPESGSAGSGTDYHAALRKLAESVLADSRWRRFDVRVLPQLHFLMWGGAAGR